MRLRDDKLDEWQKEPEEQVRHGMCAPLKWAGAVSDALAGKNQKIRCEGKGHTGSKWAKVGRKGRSGSIIDDDIDIEGDKIVADEIHS